MTKLLCLLADSLNTLVKKGEVKERYYNPGNFFDEVHFITRGTQDVPYDQIRLAVGEAKGTILTVPREKVWPLDTNPLLSTYQKKVFELVQKVNPDVIRAYDSSISGFLAVKIGELLNIPVVISVHTDMDDMRRHYKGIYNNYLKFLNSFFVGRQIERYSLSRATKVIGVYRIAVDYAKRYGAKDTSLIYNRVPIERFSPPIETERKLGQFTLIYVGNFIPGKNQATLIKAMENIEANLILIGDGPELNKCKKLAENLSLTNRIRFISSVPNSQLHYYYKMADIFVSATTYGETAIPVLEAMACGLPCVVADPLFIKTRDLIDGIALSPKNEPYEIAQAVNMLLENEDLRGKLAKMGRELMLTYSGANMEQKEVEVYKSVL
ncbi:MAG: glycosyltransferase [Bacillota bacterium]